MRAIPDLAPFVPKGVYTLTNDLTDNKIAIFERNAEGGLTEKTPVSTGGRGSSDSLADQGALIFDSKSNLFFAANAGDNSISMLSLAQDGSISLLYKIPSGGQRPISVTKSNDIVYVVNVGDNFLLPNIAGFQVQGQTLVEISNSKKNLSMKGAAPAQIQFTPDGSVLVVTERSANNIDTFVVTSGVAATPSFQASNGTSPYGFAFSAMGKLIVSEASGSASSYSIAANGTATTVTSKLASGQMAPCWVVVSGTTAYVSNAGSNNIAAYKVAADGGLTLVGNGNAGTTGTGPTDLAVTEDNKFLYALNSKDHTFSYFTIAADGSLTKKSDIQGAPMTAVGLVAR